MQIAAFFILHLIRKRRNLAQITIAQHYVAEADLRREVSMVNLSPFVLFNGNCAEAMAFYQSCLGGDLAVTKVGDTPMQHQMPPDQHAKVVYARLKTGVIEFSATDWLHATRTPTQGNTVGMYLNGRTY